MPTKKPAKSKTALKAAVQSPLDAAVAAGDFQKARTLLAELEAKNADLKASQKVEEVPVLVAPVETPAQKKVWMACRYRGGCGSNDAVLVFSRDQGVTPSNMALGGKIVRYQCLGCGGAYQIAT